MSEAAVQPDVRSRPAAPRRAQPAQPTPMMAQYIEIKSANPDCLLFYRMGDFYELFFEDAETASRALGIVLTKRGKHLGADIPMCGVPIERADEYLHRLIALGHRVAVCEQTEDPAEARRRGPKSVVRRAVVRLVTPGTLTEESLLDPRRSNRLAAVSRVGRSEKHFIYGVAALDVSTGAFSLSERPPGALVSELARLEPAEVVIDEDLLGDETVTAVRDALGLHVSPLRGPSSPERILLDWYGLATLEGLGAASAVEIGAAALALAYVSRTQMGARPALRFPTRESDGSSLQIDAATRVNLELSRSQTGDREGSLLATIDMTATAAGGRLLAERLASPLTEPPAIDGRLDAVEFFLRRPDLRQRLRDRLRAAPDLARALARLAVDRGGPRDLAAIRDGLRCAREIVSSIPSDDAPVQIADCVRAAAGLDPRLESVLAASLADDLPLSRRDGGFIRTGYSAELDQARRLRDETRGVVAGLQARYCDDVESRQLKIRHNAFLGYFIEVPPALGERLLRDPRFDLFRHRQTMAEAMRFSTQELNELDQEIASAAERALAMEQTLFGSLRAAVSAQAETVRSLGERIAELDVASALAELAALRGWSRPQVDRSLAFVAEQARHPVVEASLAACGKTFVANDCDLSGEAVSGGRIAIMTGPNMAGKSTFLRQNALLAVLAQSGSFVPAARFHLGVVDRLFSRVGAADDLARGRSTFMVEMVETAAILNQATNRSLVILDEIGRGTATFDGLSIAWATAEHLHDVVRARTLFATHFHELTALHARLDRLINLTMRVTEWRGDVVFLHEVQRGAADRSYGIQVAKLAGLPQPVIRRARTLLAGLQSRDRGGPLPTLDDLPLFSQAPPGGGRPDPAAEALAALDPDSMTPREALEALYRLKDLASGGPSPDFEPVA